MPSVRKQQEFQVPADELWSRIGDFHTLSAWHPAIESQTAEGGEQVRELHLADGGTVVETLVEEGPQTYTYRIDESPLPVADYVATMSVQDADGGSVVTWVADFRTVGATDDEAVAIIEGIFQTGLDAL
ncbi:MAG: hypothetical protein QOH43_80 [Solirubrobacteraceae bacterium]|jgi:carbon monoxide dehydrogenase subunit G|nr:hypothetical protein [Solirubrobacteraceae bacterium]